jgi:dTDP-4-amino-4,6-dideoxygalactose transaminase/glycosyltransferase involved in cell wall biosynthesis
MWPIIDKKSIQLISSALLNGRISVSGVNEKKSFVRIAELELQKDLKERKAILTCNGSSALLLALQCLDIGIGDKVIVPALTWVGVATCVLRTGADPIFIDSTPGQDPYMDLDQVEREIDSKTKAIIAPHLYSEIINVDEIRKRFTQIPIIEDASHCANFVINREKITCSKADIIIFSLQASKPLTCGEGGCILVKSENALQKVLALRNDSRVYNIFNASDFRLIAGNYHGANFNLTDMQAALLLDQLNKIEDISEQKRRRAKEFFEYLLDKECVKCSGSEVIIDSGNFYGIPYKYSDSESTVDSSTSNSKFSRLLELGCWSPYQPIPNSELYRPHLSRHFSLSKKKSDKSFPVSQNWRKERIIIPHYYFLDNAESTKKLQQICSVITESHPQFFVSSKSTIDISVVILTKNRKEKLERAIESVKKQDFDGNIELRIIGDNCDYLEDISVEKLPANIVVESDNIALNSSVGREQIVHRVSILRNIGIDLSCGKHICFLDDDNLWESHHLSSLMATIYNSNGFLAYSWRKLFLNNGEPWNPTTWPWLGGDTPQELLFKVYKELKMLDANDNILRDSFSAFYDGKDFSTIDMGEWLINRIVFETIKFKTDYSKEEQGQLVTEDDQLLIDLKEFGFTGFPSKKATLRYYLGGYSNLYNRKSNERNPSKGKQ